MRPQTAQHERSPRPDLHVRYAVAVEAIERNCAIAIAELEAIERLLGDALEDLLRQ